MRSGWHFGEEDPQMRYGRRLRSGPHFGEEVRCVLGVGILRMCIRRVGMELFPLNF